MKRMLLAACLALGLMAVAGPAQANECYKTDPYTGVCVIWIVDPGQPGGGGGGGGGGAF